MFAVNVRDHLMIAHSLHGEVFGPAQRLHGATYVVDATFRRLELDADNIVLDIGKASDELRAVVGGLGYRNLDDEPALVGMNTTTEALAKTIADRLAERVHSGVFGPSSSGLVGLTVTLHESHIAWASYERALWPDSTPQESTPQESTSQESTPRPESSPPQESSTG